MLFIGLCSNASNGIVTVLEAFVAAQTYMNLFNFFPKSRKQCSLPVPTGQW